MRGIVWCALALAALVAVVAPPASAGAIDMFRVFMDEDTFRDTITPFQHIFEDGMDAAFALANDTGYDTAISIFVKMGVEYIERKNLPRVNPVAARLHDAATEFLMTFRCAHNEFFDKYPEYCMKRVQN